MPRFRFSLEKLLRLRAQRERLVRRELAGAVAAVGEIEARLSALEGSLQACRGEIGSAVPVAELARALEGGLVYTRERVRKELEKAEEYAELTRETYRKRMRELSTLRRLRERQYSRWRIETERKSQAEMDEVAHIRHQNLGREGDKA